jgi:FemAB-related protein (PEP-CTERM system-associated)
LSIRVSELDGRTAGLWEAYASAHPECTLFHTLSWRDAVAEAFGHANRYLIGWRGDRVAGVFPLTRVDSHLAGTLLVSVPYGVYGGALADDDQVCRALLDEAIAISGQIGAQWLDIRSIRPCWPDLPVVDRYVTFRKPLPDDPDRVLAEMPRKARAAARQARERFGLASRFDQNRLEEVWLLYSQSMRRLASPNYPLRFFRALAARTRHLVQIVEHEGRAIAGLVSFIHRDTLLPYFAGCDERFEKYHPNNFMYLAAMEKAVELGCREFDFGRTRVDNQGSFDFKRFQGFEPTPLGYQYFVPEGGRAPDLTPGNHKLQLGRRVWPKLPLAVTRPLGAWLSKSIPG